MGFGERFKGFFSSPDEKFRAKNAAARDQEAWESSKGKDLAGANNAGKVLEMTPRTKGPEADNVDKDVAA